MILTVELQDVTELLRVLVWPLLLVVLLVLYRRQIPLFLQQAARRVSRISVGSLSVELATAEPLETATSFVPALRQPLEAGQFSPASGLQQFSSGAGALKDLLRKGGRADYATIDLGEGREWLTSRLFLFALMLERVLGVDTFVFVETVAPVRKRFVGSASCATVRTALANRFPWLEAASIKAFAERVGPFPGEFTPYDAMQFVGSFLREVQRPDGPAGPVRPDDWVLLAPGLSEHARWLSGSGLERVLGAGLNASRVSEPASGSTQELVRAVVMAEGDFVAVIHADGGLQKVIDRRRMVELVARRAVEAP